MGYPSTRTTRTILPKSAAERRGNRRPKKSLSTRCIITIGILLPIVGAIIGVAAWAVGNEAVHLDSSSSKNSMLYNSVPLRFRNDLFEERNDHLLTEQKKVPIGSSVFLDDLGSKMVLESEEKEQNINEATRDILDDMHHQPSPSSQEDPEKKDPLYVVHYVPQEMKPEVTSQQSVQPALGNSDVLSKILSASKVSGQKTPQFVVFAPMPADLPPHDFAGNGERSPDYEDYDEPMERPVLKKNKFKKRRKHGKSMRIMEREEETASSEIEPMRPYGSRHRLPISDDVIPAGTQESQRSASVLKQNVKPFNLHQLHQQGHQYEQQHHQQQYRHQQDRHQQDRHQQDQRQYQQDQRQYQQDQRQYQHHQQQQHGFPLQDPRHPQKPCCDAEPSNHGGQARFPQASPTFGAPLASAEHDSDRYGQVSPPHGISISFGNGQGGGSSLPISPLGILRSLLRPLNPTFDLKKKMFFGVQLENGFGLGGSKKAPSHGSGPGKTYGLTIEG